MLQQDSQVMSNQTNHVVCLFDRAAQARDAGSALGYLGFSQGEIELFDQGDACDLRATTKPCGPNDSHVRRIRREIGNGRVAIAVPVDDATRRNQVTDLLVRLRGRNVTCFGQWFSRGVK